ncbi:hypothetical protein Scep_012260 [Stephania cephalantha]|uniref:Uncharacterized protein n=1 Tax=Stephania cephalantha TaxID=152367 RepID=A0AAP0JF89_9MAGN
MMKRETNRGKIEEMKTIWENKVVRVTISLSMKNSSNHWGSNPNDGGCGLRVTIGGARKLVSSSTLKHSDLMASPISVRTHASTLRFYTGYLKQVDDYEMSLKEKETKEATKAKDSEVKELRLENNNEPIKVGSILEMAEIEGVVREWGHASRCMLSWDRVESDIWCNGSLQAIVQTIYDFDNSK